MSVLREETHLKGWTGSLRYVPEGRRGRRKTGTLSGWGGAHGPKVRERGSVLTTRK